LEQIKSIVKLQVGGYSERAGEGVGLELVVVYNREHGTEDDPAMI
jgi:hypothetical protein